MNLGNLAGQLGAWEFIESRMSAGGEEEIRFATSGEMFGVFILLPLALAGLVWFIIAASPPNPPK